MKTVLFLKGILQTAQRIIQKAGFIISQFTTLSLSSFTECYHFLYSVIKRVRFKQLKQPALPSLSMK